MEKELNTAESKSMPPIIAKMGYNRNTNRKLLYGPTKYLGAGLVRWKWIQGAGQITNILKYWQTPGRIGKAYRIAIA